MGLEDAVKIAAGPDNQVYALAKPFIDGGGYQLYRWKGYNTWQKLLGMGAEQVAVGKFGRPIVVDGDGRIFWPECID